MKAKKQIHIALSYILVAVISICGTLMFTTYRDGAGYMLKRIIINNYVDDVDENKLSNASNSAMVAALGDSHSFYIPGDYGLDSFEQSVTGEYCGIGVTISMNNEKQVVVIGVFKDSPAEKSGMKPNDIIVKVNGQSIIGKTSTDASALMKGKEGTSVNITVQRKDKEISMDVKREKINVQCVTSKKLDNNIGYICISSFDGDVNSELKNEIKELGDISGLIIDLRDNPGGIMGNAIDCIDMFLDKGNIVTTRYKNSEKTYKATAEKLFDKPMAVLVNGNSASASEIFSAAIKENKRGNVVGVKTYGKGSIQRTFILPGNAGANITIGRFYSPDDNKINHEGVTPNVIVELPSELKEKPASALTADEDTQLKAAIETLK